MQATKGRRRHELQLVHPEAPPAGLRYAPFVYIDLFCGAGGSVTGALAAFARLGLGKPGDRHVRVITVNHNAQAVATIKLNHPEVEAIDCDLEKLDPNEVLQGDKGTIMWGSAPCQPYSVAANGPYSRPQQRATPDYILKWLDAAQPEVYIEENVRQIVTKWPGWQAHVNNIRARGYRVEYRIDINAADHGVPQDRRRLILVATRNDQPITWPKQSHSNPKKLLAGTMPWRGADTFLDLKRPCPSIFGRKKPHSPKSRARVARFIREQGAFWEPLAVAVENYTGKVGLGSLLEACPEENWPTWITRVGDELHILPPKEHHITKFYRNERGSRLSKPSPTILTGGGRGGGHLGVVEQRFVDKDGRDVVEAMGAGDMLNVGAITCLLPSRGPNGGELANKHRSIARPANTLVAGKSSGSVVELRVMASPGVVMAHHGEAPKQLPRIHRAHDPMPTIPAGRGYAVAFVFLYTFNGKANCRMAHAPNTTETCVERHAVYEVRLDDLFADVGMRMLTTLELALGQSFPSAYVFTGTKGEQTRQIGNAVPPWLALAIVLAALGHLGITGRRLTDFAPWGSSQALGVSA